MFRIAIQVKELISSNVTSALDAAANPAKMLGKLQREIEEALISLTGEVAKAKRQQERLGTALTQADLEKADWSDKAKVAMDNGREDLARQALHAREDCRLSMERMKNEAEQLKADLKEMGKVYAELEAKRDDLRTKLADERTAQSGSAENSGGSGYAQRTADRIDYLNKLEKRVEFVSGETTACRGDATVSREIEEMRLERKIDQELDALRGSDKAEPAPARKRPTRSKAA